MLKRAHGPSPRNDLPVGRDARALPATHLTPAPTTPQELHVNTPFTDHRPLPYPTLPEALTHWATTTPDAIVLTAATQEVTYAQFADQVDRCAAWLQEQGVSPGDRVVIV